MRTDFLADTLLQTVWATDLSDEKNKQKNPRETHSEKYISDLLPSFQRGQVKAATAAHHLRALTSFTSLVLPSFVESATQES